MVKIELTDNEVTTVLVALDNYRNQKTNEWLSDGCPSAEEDADSAELCWQKISTVQQEHYNSIADAIGEGETNNPITASVDPFGLPTWSDT